MLEFRPLNIDVEADFGMPLLDRPGSSEEIAVKPPRPFAPMPSALLSGLSVAPRCPATVPQSVSERFSDTPQP